ncbi:hypothetical protein [Vibrio sp. 99-70-13A1]|uniref:hypothetical protein n=1 Tax=Vibrio sp. 99-70-13A1 TaxID=2607601 RepID=UPI00149364BB|nr:hypothetical protein [Vibrio sp. 99-70-13A1]NOH95226.1 hypothetical protein [Vibrio sp. 99-70-13A1]
MTMKQVVLCGLAASLAGCGGSSSGGDSSSVSVTGKVIDGYIIGATVYLDLNFNNQLDANEPNVITQEQGEFDLTIPSTYRECAQYVPIVVDVPEGAIDTDFPDTPIEDAYKMVIPPQYALSTDEDLYNLTPLTSVVWSEVEKELFENTSQELSCDSMLKEQELREDIAQRLEEQELRVANRYNITVDDLYGDYIESGNDQVHQIAQDIVPGLQKSYADTRELIAQYPQADLAWVEYFLGKWDSSNSNYDDAWYRYQFVQASNGNFESETYEMSDDLNTKVLLHDKNVMETTVRDGVNIEKTVSLEPANTGYHCSLSEWLETISQKSSGVRNTVYGLAGDWSDCDKGIVNDKFIVQALVTKDFQGHELISYTEHSYDEGNDSGFTHLIGVTDTITESDLTPVRSAINTDFYSEEGHGADFWSRVMNESGEDPSQIMTSHTSDGEWQRSTYYKNGTHKKECGTSEADLSEENCSK